jgi:hypothetical protein
VFAVGVRGRTVGGRAAGEAGVCAVVAADAPTRHCGDDCSSCAEAVAVGAEPRRGLCPDTEPHVWSRGFAHMFDYSPGVAGRRHPDA